MNIFRLFTFIIIFMVHSPAKGKSWKEIIQKRILNESNQILCEGDIYKSKNGTSPLMKRVIEAVKKVKDKATVKEKFLFTKGHVDHQVYRSGDEIFFKMAKMIEKAEKEVLLQTYIFDMNSKSSKIVYDGIVKLEAKRKKMKAKKPIVVRFIYDVEGTKLITWGDFAGIKQSFMANNHYTIKFPKKLDPRYVRFEVKGYKHINLLPGGHSKTIVVDRHMAMVTGANFIDYHHVSEEKTPMGSELMVDHGFVVSGEPALGLANEFYTLWHKNKGKIQGRAVELGGNVKADEMYPWDERPYPKKEINSVIEFLKGNKVTGPILVGNVGKDSDGRRRKKESTINPQNAAFRAIMKNAKSHINIASPSLNSLEFMELIVKALERGVDVNFLLSKNYQDFNKLYQEGGTNYDAVKWINKRWKKLKKRRVRTPINTLLDLWEGLLKNPKGKKIGNFTVTWFVTRGGNLSGRDVSKRYRFTTRFREKFWNHNHTKYLSADNQVSLVGSANIDEQSWYNSREANIVIDNYKVSKSWCEKAFKTDFLKGLKWGRQLWEGEPCWVNSQCASQNCNKRLSKGTNFRCIYQKGKGLSGGYCDKAEQCRSKKCNLKLNECS